ncbi:hypothetical protein SKAU_G00096070 [Synaphobranchus kaupii]|uniref:Uncharacterized protein n=1 Tax=Synaphobranchus kaupii TaxID=118154 RepID=A0A9Q1FXC5_SYNKA|nr:hypothetical protein SKAU_G00096070 [Synaphobranchus kaupii]
MHMRSFTRLAHTNHVRKLILPSVLHRWRTEQVVLLQGLREKDKATLGGDMRADSPGHSAKYRVYSMKDLDTNQNVDIQLVQAQTLAKWTSLLNHVQNVHVHENQLFPKCLHPPSTAKSKWLKPAKATYRLEKVLVNKRVLTDVKKLSPLHQTSALEGFHSVILRFVAFSYLGMMCSKLMDLLFNEVISDPAPFVAELLCASVPEPLCAQYERPDKAEAIAGYVSRFSRTGGASVTPAEHQ